MFKHNNLNKFIIIISLTFSFAIADCTENYPKKGNKVCKMNDGSIIYIQHINNYIIINNKYKAYTKDILKLDKIKMVVISQREELVSYYERRGYIRIIQKA